MSFVPKSKELQLWEAANQGDLARVKELSCDPHVDVNWQDSTFKNTVFFRACYAGRVHVARYLMQDPRVNVVLPQKEEATPFFIACQEGHTELVELLLNDDRIDVNQGMKNNASPLCIASQNGFLGLVQRILASDHVVDTRARTSEGTDPWSDMNCVELSRWAATQPRFGWENEEGHQRRLKNCGNIAELIIAYQGDERKVKHKLRSLKDFRDPYIGKLFSLIIFFSDDYLRLPTTTTTPSSSSSSPRASEAPLKIPHQTPATSIYNINSHSHSDHHGVGESPGDEPPPHKGNTDELIKENSLRFLKIAKRIPMELQMVLCHRTFGSSKDIVTSAQSEPAFLALGALLAGVDGKHHS